MIHETSTIRIEPEAFYEANTVRHLFGMTSTAFRRAQIQGGLRGSKQGLRTFHKGQWILDWLEESAQGKEVQTDAS